MENRSSVYRHRQVGVLTFVALALGIVFSAVLFYQIVRVDTRVAIIPGVVLAVLVLCVLIFGILTVEVTDDRLAFWFGLGLIRKSYPLHSIRAVGAVKNRWFYGWGIRYTPHGWLYNVSGLDAVEIQLADGKRFRIGTDEPLELASALKKAARLHG